jgi:hypothetical protein
MDTYFLLTDRSMSSVLRGNMERLVAIRPAYTTLRGTILQLFTVQPSNTASDPPNLSGSFPPVASTRLPRGRFVGDSANDKKPLIHVLDQRLNDLVAGAGFEPAAFRL